MIQFARLQISFIFLTLFVLLFFVLWRINRDYLQKEKYNGNMFQKLKDTAMIREFFEMEQKKKKTKLQSNKD